MKLSQLSSCGQGYKTLQQHRHSAAASSPSRVNSCGLPTLLHMSNTLQWTSVWGQRLFIVRLNELCMCVCDMWSVTVWCVMQYLVMFCVTATWRTEHSLQLHSVWPKYPLPAGGGREGAVPTKFRGSLHNIRRRRLSNTVCRLLMPNGGGHQILLKLLRNSVATSSVVEGGVVQCVVEGGGTATQNVSH